MRVMVVDQHPVVRAGIATVLSDDPDVEIVGFAESGEGAVAEAQRLHPDLIVMGVRLIGLSGVEACRLLRLQHPATKVVLMTSEPSSGAIARALTAEPHGLIFKRSELDSLKDAIRTVAAGTIYVDPSLQVKMSLSGSNGLKGPFKLTPTEIRVLEYLVQGLTNAEIGERLDVSTNTIKTHLKNAMFKLRARDRAHAAAIAVREGLA